MANSSERDCNTTATSCGQMYYGSRCSRQWELARTMGKKDMLALKKFIAWEGFDSNEVFSTDRETASPMFMAVDSCWIQCLQLLVECGGNINQQVEIVECRHVKSRNLVTPLMMAIEKHHMELVRAVMNLGADVSICDTHTNVSPVYLAASTNQPCVLAFLLNSICPQKKLGLGDDWQFRDLQKMLCNLATTNFHATPLAAALVNMGFRAQTIFPSEPFTLLKCDILRQDKALLVAEILLSFGANMNAKEGFLGLPLSFLCSTWSDTRMMSLFIRYGLEVNQVISTNTHPTSNISQYLQLPVSLVSFYINAKYFTAVRALVEAGCNLCPEDKHLILQSYKELQNGGEGGTVTYSDENMQSLWELVDHITSVPSMQWLCKKRIRNTLHPSSEINLKKLPLPSLLLKYICQK